MRNTMGERYALNELPQKYLALLEPSTALLLVFSCISSMIVAANTLPSALVWAVTILASLLLASGTNAIRQVHESATKGNKADNAGRSMFSGRIVAQNALLFGVALVAWSVLLLGVFVNWLAAGLALAAALVALVVYAPWLQQETGIHKLIAAAAAAIHVLVGWAAATGQIELRAFILFAIVFYWKMPHSLARGLLANIDTAAEDITTMPSARSENLARYRVLFYSIQLFVISLTPALLLLLPQAPPMLGWVYLLSALALGLHLIWRAVKLIRLKDKATARSLYKYSSLYLAFLFLAMIVDRLLL